MEAIKKLFTPEGFFVTKFSKIETWTWITIGLIIAFAIVLIIVSKVNKKTRMTTRMLVTGALCLSAAFVLSYIRLINLPQGGSVTMLSLLPLIIFSYIYGAIPGLTVCFAYSLLQIIQELYIVHWFQFILDYPLAFTLIGLAGLFKNNIYFAAVTAYVLRYICHVISGLIFFREFAEPAGFSSVFLYSILYNSFAILELAVCLAVLAIPAVRKMSLRLKNQYA